MKLELTEKQIETLLEAVDFWQGSLIGIEEYKSEYKRAEKIGETLLEKRREARSKTPAKKSKVVGCLNCGYRTTDSQEIAEWTGCPNCSKN